TAAGTMTRARSVASPNGTWTTFGEFSSPGFGGRGLPPVSQTVGYAHGVSMMNETSCLLPTDDEVIGVIPRRCDIDAPPYVTLVEQGELVAYGDQVELWLLNGDSFVAEEWTENGQTQMLVRHADA